MNMLALSTGAVLSFKEESVRASRNRLGSDGAAVVAARSRVVADEEEEGVRSPTKKERMPLSFRMSSGADPVTIGLRFKGAGQANQADYIYVAERQKARIITRTYRGVDFEERAFVKYSEGYAKRKQKSGRDSGIVNLSWTGRMLKALVVRAVSASRYFTIGIYGEEGIRAGAHNSGEGKMPMRKFVAASRADKEAMSRDFEARIRARLNGTTLNA